MNRSRTRTTYNVKGVSVDDTSWSKDAMDGHEVWASRASVGKHKVPERNVVGLCFSATA